MNNIIIKMTFQWILLLIHDSLWPWTVLAAESRHRGRQGSAPAALDPCPGIGTGQCDPVNLCGKAQQPMPDYHCWQLAKSSGVKLIWDAEQTYLQPAIEALILDSMRILNQESPVIANTYQCYLKVRPLLSASVLPWADEEAPHWGFSYALCRGRAKSLKGTFKLLSLRACVLGRRLSEGLIWSR